MNHSISELRLMIVRSNQISISEQCKLLCIHRPGFYYVPTGESDENLDIIRLIDAYFLEHPHSGVITMCVYLCLDKDYRINIKRGQVPDAPDWVHGYLSGQEAQYCGQRA